MTDRERKIKEERQREANRKNLSGMEGKIGTVLRNLGHPIMKQGADWFSTTEFDSPYNWDYEETALPTMNEGEGADEIGTVFDGLSWGMHLEITYIIERQELRLTYQGYKKYVEVAGELECFVPGEWEQKVDDLYKRAKKVEGERFREIALQNREENREMRKSFLAELRERWGI